MNKNEAQEFLTIYKSFYALKLNQNLFIQNYCEEFPSVPLYIMRAAFNNWRKGVKGCYPPTIMEIKEKLWRIKLIAQSKIFDDEYNRKWNAEKAGRVVDYFDEIINQKVSFTYEPRPVLSDEKLKELNELVFILSQDLGEYNAAFE